MIHFVNFTPFLHFFINILQYFMCTNNLLDQFEDDLDIIMMVSMGLRVYVQYLNMYIYLSQYMDKSMLKRRRKLVKPHILISLLHRYRYKFAPFSIHYHPNIDRYFFVKVLGMFTFTEHGCMIMKYGLIYKVIGIIFLG